ncbi:MAG: hypothetical protein COA96_16925 [SAR86 cluster bacterium]|uniref:Uncharacterized protein n=1 Tax=SAR86 cluster bacterium TaxID=2030880 RepID=A0A2A5AG41_9GAMM|nr:MAG: hypothetical protein COA96_16925 [SAR86 cluster bacterium]
MPDENGNVNEAVDQRVEEIVKPIRLATAKALRIAEEAKGTSLDAFKIADEAKMRSGRAMSASAGAINTAKTAAHVADLATLGVKNTHNRIDKLHPDDPSGGDPGGGDPGGGDPGGGDPGGEDKIEAGMNLVHPTYWWRSHLFADLALTADFWRDDGTAYVYASGYAPTGNYVLKWEGTDDIDVPIGGVVLDRSSRAILFRIEQGTPIIGFRNTAGHDDPNIRNITILPERYVTADGPFSTKTVKRLRKFKVLRFMDMQRTNHAKQRKWEARTRPGDPQNTNRGTAIEHMVDLCNVCEAVPWFCLPHLGDLDYCEQFGRMVRSRMTGAVLYLEYSNELWNGRFAQARWMAEGVGMYSDAYFKKWVASMNQSVEAFVRGHGDRSRIKVVLGTQLHNTWIAKQLIKFGAKFDVISPSAYFGFPSDDGPTTVEEAFDRAPGIIATENRRLYREHMDIARAYGAEHTKIVPMVAYEGGQHWDDPYDDRDDMFMEANRDPRMYDLYQQNMVEFEAAGGELIVGFNDVGSQSKSGSWGHLLYEDQPLSEAHKQRAIEEYERGRKLPID